MPENPFDSFRLSKSQLYLNSRPEIASLYAQGIKKILDDPEIKPLLEKRGLYAPAQVIFDSPLTVEGIKDYRATDRGGRVIKGMETGIGFALGLGLSGGDIARRMGVGAARFLGQFGIDAGNIDANRLEKDVRNLWIFGRDDPVSLLTQMGANMASLFLGTSAAAAGLAAAGLRGGMALTAANGLGAAGITSLEEAGKAILQGEKFDAGRVAIEGTIFSLAGLPFRGGAIMNRLKSALLTGGAALVLPPIFGKEVDTKRAGMEVLFSAIFGNPKIREYNAKVPHAELTGKQHEVLTDVAASSDGLTKKEMSARASLVEKTKTEPPKVLEKAATSGGAEAGIARDGLAAQKGEIVPPDAPPVNTLLDPDLVNILQQMRDMTEEQLFATRDASTGEMRKILDNALEERLHRGTISMSVFDNTALAGRTGKQLGVQPPTAQNVTTLKELVERQEKAAKGSEVQKAVASEAEAEIFELEKKIASLESSQKPDKGAIEALKTKLEALKAKLGEDLQGEPMIVDKEQASRILEEILTEKTEAQIRRFVKNLPPTFQPFMDEVSAVVKKVLSRRPVRGFDADVILKRLLEEGGVTPRDDVPVVGEMLDTLVPPQKKRLARNLFGTRKLAAEHGLRVDPILEEGHVAGYSVTKDGTELRFPTLKAVENHLKKIGSETPETLQGLAAIANRRGIAVRHAGNGQIQTLNMLTGRQQIHENLEKALEAVKQEQVPPAPDFTPNIPLSMPGMGGMPPVGSEPKPSLGLVEPKKMPGVWAESLGTAKWVMTEMQNAVKVPIVDKVWRPLIRAMSQRNNFSRPYATRLRKIFKPIRKGRWRVVQDLFIAGENQKAVAKMHGGVTRGELRAARELGRWYKDLLGLDDEGLRQFSTEAIPKMRKANGDPARAASDMWTFPASLTELLDDVFQGKITLDTDDALALAQETLAVVGRKRFLNEPLGEARKVLWQLDNLERTWPEKGASGKELREFDRARQAVRQANAYTRMFIDRVSNDVSASAERTAEILTTHMNGLRKLFGVKGPTWTPRDVERISLGLTSYQSGIAMSGRIALAVRNYFQMLLNAPKVGYGVTFDAIRRAFTKEGWNKVKASGVIEVPRMFVLDEIQSAYPGILGEVQNAHSFFLGPYRHADGVNRGVSYLAGHGAIRKWEKYLRKGDWKRFIYETGLITDSPTFQARIRKIAQEATEENWAAAVEKMGHEYGLHLAEETQYVYNRVNAPKLMQGVIGRAFGQFGLWPISFLEYMRRNVGGAQIFSLRKSLKGRAGARFLARWMGQRAVLMTVGALTGINLWNYNNANPLVFEGGPWWQLVRDMINLVGASSEFEARVARSNIMRHAQTGSLPFGAELVDIEQALEEPNPWISLMLLLSFNIKTTKQRQSEARRRLRR